MLLRFLPMSRIERRLRLSPDPLGYSFSTNASFTNPAFRWISASAALDQSLKMTRGPRIRMNSGPRSIAGVLCKHGWIVIGQFPRGVNDAYQNEQELPDEQQHGGHAK